MNLLPKRYVFESRKNGRIVVTEWLKRVSVVAGGAEQSGTYDQTLLEDAVGKIPASARIKHILMAGLGGGCAITKLEERFPEAEITVVEWDPVMVTIAKRFSQWKREPVIIVNDIFDVLSQLFQSFDLVIMDVFYGGTPDARLVQEENARAVSKIVSPGGFLVLNASENPHIIPAFKQHVSLIDSWRYKYNAVAIFRRYK